MFRIPMVQTFSLLLVLILTVPFVFVACGDDDDDDTTPPMDELAFITTTDYSTGSFMTVSLDVPRDLSENIGTVSSDPVCYYYAPYVYVVNRYGFDNIQIFDPDDSFSLIAEYSVESGTNPQEIVIVSDDKAYVSRLAATSLLALNPMTGETLTEIDMTPYADSDGFAEMSGMFYHAASQYLFVALQRLDTTTYTNVAPSYVVVIDTTTDAIVTAIACEGVNPFSDFFYRAETNKLYLGNVGIWDENDGGIEMFNMTTLVSEGFIVTEEALGGDILDVAIFSDTTGYALISDASYVTHVVVFNPTTGALSDTLLSSAGYDLNALEINNRDELWILDRTIEKPSIHIFNAATQGLDQKLTLSGLPPASICFLENE